MRELTWNQGEIHAEEEVQFGADYCQAAPDRSATRPRQKRRAGLQGRCHLGAKLKDECLKLEIFYSLKEAQVIIGAWRDHYNRVRPHSSLGYRPPAPMTMEALAQQLPTPTIMQ